MEVDNNRVLNSLTYSQGSEPHCNSSYKLSHSSYLNINKDNMLNEVSSNSSSNNTVSNISYILDYSSVITDNRYLTNDN
jgi:hypothetical protein